jgi:vacuolar-type H+-ATPase subunit E/Vma4
VVPGTAGPLLEQIRSTAVAAATEKVTGARTDADAIRTGARDRAQRERASAVAAHERGAATASSRTRAETAARVGRDTLTARAAALDRIFVAANHRFASLASHPGLRDLLVATLNDGLTYLPDGAATVACAGAIADAVRAALAATKREDVTVRLDETVPIGVMIEAGDGSVAVDGTFARRLARERPRLSTVLARRLVEHPK